MGRGGNRGGTKLARNRSESSAGVIDRAGNVHLEQFGDVSAELKAEIQAFLNGLSPGLLAVLKEHGMRFGVGKDFQSVLPDLANERPPGWPEGTTWKNAEGGYMEIGGRKMAFATEFKEMFSGRVVRSGRILGVFRHEVGHAVDSALGTASSSRQFRAAYNRDVRKMSATTREALTYYLQPGSSGRQETFAESFGAMRGGGAASGTPINHYFPSVARYMKNKVFKGKASR